MVILLVSDKHIYREFLNFKDAVLGAGVVEMKFFTTVNVSDVKISGTATRGEKIDKVSYQFEGTSF